MICVFIVKSLWNIKTDTESLARKLEHENLN